MATRLYCYGKRTWKHQLRTAEDHGWNELEQQECADGTDVLYIDVADRPAFARMLRTADPGDTILVVGDVLDDDLRDRITNRHLRLEILPDEG